MKGAPPAARTFPCSPRISTISSRRRQARKESRFGTFASAVLPPSSSMCVGLWVWVVGDVVLVCNGLVGVIAVVLVCVCVSSNLCVGECVCVCCVCVCVCCVCVCIVGADLPRKSAATHVRTMSFRPAA